MEPAIARFRKLFNLLNFADKEGHCPTGFDRVVLFRVARHHASAPLMYQQGVFLFAQGRKVGYVNKARIDYGPEHFLIVTTPYPIRCETIASPEKPMMGMLVKFDPPMILDLVQAIEKHQGAERFHANRTSRGVQASPTTVAVFNNFLKLLDILASPQDCDVLGEQAVRELFYTILLGEHGHVLADFARKDSTLARLNHAVLHLHREYAQKIAVEDLASMAGMSVSSFHRAFKQALSDSPLQYLKKIRLNQAKALITNQGLAANSAAYQVGYESPAQFSREFKRYFGLPPSKANHLGGQEPV